MKQYLVISVNDENENDVQFDTVLADSNREANRDVNSVRKDSSVDAVYLLSDFAVMVAKWAAETQEQTKESWALTVACYAKRPEEEDEAL